MPSDLARAATFLSDEELADLIHELSDSLHERLNARKVEGSWLKRQLDNNRIVIRSWPTWQQNLIKDQI